MLSIRILSFENIFIGLEAMSNESIIKRFTQLERVNFLLTNRLPRKSLTLFVGWFSRIENPVIRWLSIRLWQIFSDDLDLTEAKKQSFSSMQDCFIRQLKPEARTIDAAEDVVVSPCDAILGAHGQVVEGNAYQIKGFPYGIQELLQDPKLVARYRDGQFVTLRLQSTMYHRFHAPIDCHISQVNYISGDTWNVNPIALKRVEQLYCKNERAVIDLELKQDNIAITLVPVAAILVASMKFHCLDDTLDLRYQGPNRLSCDASYEKGDELGYFQQGSTIIIFASKTLKLLEGLASGDKIKMGQALFTL